APDHARPHRPHGRIHLAGHRASDHAGPGSRRKHAVVQLRAARLSAALARRPGPGYAPCHDRRLSRPLFLLTFIETSPMSTIFLDNITKQYGEAPPAVNQIGFEVQAGTFTVLLGPSGCGKSTTLRMIAGLDTPSSGRIRI